MDRRRLPGIVLPLAAVLALAGCGGAGSATAPQPARAANPSRAATASSSSAATSALSASTSASSSSKPAVTSGAAAALASTAPSGAITTIRFGMIPSIASAPEFVPQDDGAMAAAGVKLDFTTVTDTTQALVAVAAGQLDVATISLSAAALNLFHRGADLKLVASGGMEGPGHSAFLPVLARTDLYDSGALKTLGQLKGHKVASNSKGTESEYALNKALGIGQLKLADVDMVLMPWPDMVVGLGNKSIDAALIAQPLATQAIQKGVAKIVSDDYSVGTQDGLVVANTKFLQQHSEAMTSFLEVYIKAIGRLGNGKVKNDPAALASIQKWVKTTPAVIKAAPDEYWPQDGKINRASVADEQAYYLQTKEVDYAQALNVDQLIDESYLDAALKRISG